MGKLNLTGKSALVTGANRGIGEAYVRYLIERGVQTVYACARERNNLKHLEAEYGDRITSILLDVTRVEHIEAIKGKISSLDILINNAGVANACFSTSDNALEVARLEMETNYFGPLQITQALLPLLRQSSHGVIVNVSSIAGISNFPAIGPYSATKAALHSYTQGLRAELAGDGIRVLGVYPGPIDTRMAADFEMEKPPASQVAEKTFEALHKGEVDVLPDDFAVQMYHTFLEHPHELEKVFAGMQ